MPFFVGWRLTPYPTYGPCGLPLIYSPCWLILPLPMASKPPVALPLTGELLQPKRLTALQPRLGAARHIYAFPPDHP
ncbi:hypothetical protein B9037_009915 [Klebsiella aerogenes]|nr:hypothetical protein B9037_009915 [Klebsiella aerogenes]